MKAKKMFTILVLAVFFGSQSKAAPMGTGFTYQGRLMEGEQSAEGLYDLEFRLFDGPADGNQTGGTAEANDVDVIDGYFTVELDFGSDVFDGDARWLEVAIRPGALTDPNLYVTLPAGHLGYRYQVLNFDPIYYGVHGSSTTNGNNVGVYGSASGGTSNWAGYFNGDVYAGGKVGIGTTSPQADLDIKHKEGYYRVIQATASDGSELFNVGEHPLGNGYLVIMDGDGTSKVLITANGNSYFNGGNVAIDGELTVSGAYKGDIGPNNGAPFLRPAYDSHWVYVAPDSGITLTHNIGGDVDNYVVDLQFKLGSNIHNQGYGGDGGRSTVGPYVLTGTIGRPNAAYSRDGNFKLLGCFWPGGSLCFVDFEHLARFAEL